MLCDKCNQRRPMCACWERSNRPVMLKMELQSAVALLRTHNIIKVPEVTKMLKMITRRSKAWK